MEKKFKNSTHSSDKTVKSRNKFDKMIWAQVKKCLLIIHVTLYPQQAPKCTYTPTADSSSLKMKLILINTESVYLHFGGHPVYIKLNKTSG